MQVEVRKATVTFIEDEGVSTTATYTRVSIGNMSIKAVVDYGVVKTCISIVLDDELGLKINVASEVYLH